MQANDLEQSRRATLSDSPESTKHKRGWPKGRPRKAITLIRRSVRLTAEQWAIVDSWKAAEKESKAK